MISYAQNQEDVVLWRLTKIVKDGIFVDIGAAHPVLENVTYALYLNGWRGINVEPMQREAQMLREVRPEDITIEKAVGRNFGQVTLYEAPLENRGSTTCDHITVESYRSQGQSFKEVTVEMTTLDEVLKNYSPGQVHILKIDVEGLETDVLTSGNLTHHLPWVLVIESTRPNSPEDCSFEWEKIVLDAGYRMVLFDGLNRFYVRNDMEDVQSLLSKPANVFDDWSSREQAAAVEYAQSLRAELTVAEGYAQSLRAELNVAVEYAESLRATLDARNSERENFRKVELELEEAKLYIKALLESIERINS